MIVNVADEATLTHLDTQGRARMVDVTEKPWTRRLATARGRVATQLDAAMILASRPEVFTQARVAGAEAAKRAWDLIPLCHPIRLVGVTVDFVCDDTHVEVQATTQVYAPTGVEMEALTAVTVAGLVLVHHLRHHDPDATLTDVGLWRKEGGRSGIWVRSEQ